MTRLNLCQLFLPFGRILSAGLISNGTCRRKLFAPFPRPYCLDNQPRVKALLPRLNDWIERTAPAATQQVDRRRRVGARADRPHHFVGIGNVDIIIDDNNVATEVSAGMALTGD